MMNLPFKFRQLDNSCIPKGPSFNQAQAISFSINNTSIELMAPKHKSGYSSIEQLKPKRHHLLSDLIFRDFPETLTKDNSWEKVNILNRSWSFFGPWFTGIVAELPFSITIIRTTNKNSASYFHPRAFEDAISNYLTQQFGYAFNTDGRQEWLGPINWKRLNNLGARFKVIPNSETYNSGFVHEYAIYPITDDVLLVFTFWLEQIVAGSPEDKDKLVDKKPLEELASKIINSIKIDLSPEAQAQKDKALEGLDDTSLSTNFAPLKWSNSEQLINTNDAPDTLSLNNN